MALKRYKNGTFEITSLKQVREAYKRMQEYSKAVQELEKEHNIDELRQDATNLKLSADSFLIKSNKDHLEIPEIGKRATVVRGHDGSWVETKADLNAASTATKSLRSIVGKEIWLKITKRVVDPDKLAEAVATGLVDEDEISAAYDERPRKPYVRLYDDEG